MARIEFTRNLQRLVPCPSADVHGSTIGEALDDYFAAHSQVRSYVLDDQGRVRKHVTVFINGDQLADRTRLTDPLGPNDDIHVFQALSGG